LEHAPKSLKISSRYISWICDRDTHINFKMICTSKCRSTKKMISPHYLSCWTISRTF
jgi:hypothetical protein